MLSSKLIWQALLYTSVISCMFSVKLVMVICGFASVDTTFGLLWQVSYPILRKDIVNLLDYIERLTKEEDRVAPDMNQIQELKWELTFIWTFVQLSYFNLEGFTVKMSGRSVLNVFHSLDRDNIPVKYNMDLDVSCLQENIECFISSQYHSESSATMTEEQLVELLDSLLVNLRDLSIRGGDLITPFMTQYEILQNVCSNIRDFHWLKVNGCIENEIVEDVLPESQLMAARVGLLWFEIWEYELDGERTVDVSKLYFGLAQLFVKIIPVELEIMHICSTFFRASNSAEVGRFIRQLLEASPDILSGYLVHLQEHMVNVNIPSTSARNIHVMVEFLLIICTDVPKNLIHHDKLFDLVVRVGALTREVSILIRNFEANSRNEENTNETNCATQDMLENIELLKRDLKHVYLSAPADSSRLWFPMSDGPLFMHLLLRNLNDLLNSNAYSVALVKEEIQHVKEDLNFIRSNFLGNAEEEPDKDLWTRVFAVAYEANDVIHSILVRDNGLMHLIFSLPNTIEKIKLIKDEVSILPLKTPKNKSPIVVSSSNKRKSNSSTGDKIFVGFEEEIKKIIRQLIRGPPERDVISIIGMPGLGKTTLADKVYNDKSVDDHFDIRAWCTVDQVYDRKKMLQKIYKQVTGLDQTFNEDFDVDDELRRKLYTRRYLIVLDDLWDITAWDDLISPFPKVENGSRIILTSREKEVALHGKCHSEPLNLRLLRPEESWELLEKRVFREESCPVELLDVGKEIAQKCQGLPLVADLIAGVIAKKEKKKTLWLEVLENLSSFSFESGVEVMKVIQLSYDHLPDHIKPCLLYLASFAKDEEIKVDELKAFWCTEGLVEQTEMKSVEDVLDVYFANLVSSSLVIVLNQMGIFGTSCKLHDIVHGFCLGEARKEQFFDLITSSVSSSDLRPRQMTIHHDQKLIQSNSDFLLFDSEKKRHSGKHLLSLKITGDGCPEIYHLRQLRLLRVLNLATVYPTCSLLNEIGMLIHLRYLNIQMNVNAALPLSLSSLWNMETLVVNNNNSTMVLLPRIWNLAKLRCVNIDFCSFLELDTDEPILLADDSKLENLKILREIKLSYSKDTVDIFKRFPNLQKLDCSVIESWDVSAECNWFPKLDVLNKLEILETRFDGQSPAATHPCDFHFPSSLKILILCLFHLTSDSLSTIARLPNLEELCLLETFIQGKELNMVKDTFKNLKVLALSNMSLAKWEVGEESFPKLEKLFLAYFCDELKEIPPSFGDSSTLKSIELLHSPNLIDSAQTIKEYMEDITGEDKLRIIVRD